MTAVTFEEMHTVFTRAGSNARGFGPTGALATYAANAPRLVSDPATLAFQGLLSEGPFSNLISNPEWTGTVPGTPGTNPTGHDFTASAGVSRELIGVVTEDDIAALEIRWFATSPAGSNNMLRLGGVGGFACTQGQTARLGFRARLMAGGVTTGVTFRTYLQDVGGSPTTVSYVPTSAPLRSQPFGVTRVGAAAGMSAMTAYIGFLPTSATPFDFRLRIGLPMASVNQVLGSFVNGTRNEETIRRPLGAEWTPAAWTKRVRAVVPQASPAGVDQVVWQISDGTNANALRLYVAAGGLGLRFGAIVAGVETSVAIGNVIAGTPFLCVVGGGGGTYGASLNQAAAVALSAAQPAGLTTLHWGQNATPGAWLNGAIERLSMARGRVADADLPAVPVG